MSYTISRAASAAGVGVETIRFYEREGLLRQPPRKPGRYRQYDDSTIARIHFIQRAKLLGFTLAEIRELIQLDERDDAECGDLRDRARVKLTAVEQKIADLERMRSALNDLIAACRTSVPLSQCPVMECLFSG